MSALMSAVSTNREQITRDTYDWLVRHGRGQAIDELMARMLASLVAGAGKMPRRLGLCEAEFERFAQAYFPGIAVDLLDVYGGDADMARRSEHEELNDLFLSHADPRDDEAEWVATLLTFGCMGSDHLWQDLGLWSRKDLTALISYRFSGLAVKNTKDMKWKKFFYKQLCEREGVHACRAPSCAVCDDYAVCFGPED